MILLPYIHNVTTLQQISVHSYTILTIGGTTLWSEDISTNAEAEDMVQANDMYVDSIVQNGDVFLCLINTQKTKCSDFFKWNEITDADTFCWRTFYTFGEKQNWLPHPHEEMSGYSYEALCTMIDSTQCRKDI